jgi:hypothetical protein
MIGSFSVVRNDSHIQSANSSQLHQQPPQPTFACLADLLEIVNAT